MGRGGFEPPTQIFSPSLLFISPCGIKVNGCKLKTYETDGRPMKHQSSTKGASLVRVLVRVVQFTRYILHMTIQILVELFYAKIFLSF